MHLRIVTPAAVVLVLAAAIVVLMRWPVSMTTNAAATAAGSNAGAVMHQRVVAARQAWQAGDEVMAVATAAFQQAQAQQHGAQACRGQQHPHGASCFAFPLVGPATHLLRVRSQYFQIGEGK